ncbi:MAG TPA: efflux RND transporter periplasmic adaptor subunit [Panacibacter sp.]|nr:efflux RND transporter periplasmic adaptor subunit [Panacibacter sp.]
MQKLLIYIALIISIASCKGDAAVEEPKKIVSDNTTVDLDSAQLNNAGIVTDTPSIQTIHTIIKANGTVDVPPQSMVSVSFPLGGYLKTTSLLPGASVKKGEVIAVMEDQSYVQLQQDYLSAKARMDYLTEDVQRQKELSDADAASKKNYQLVLSDFKIQQVLIKSLEEKLKIIGINPSTLNVNSISRDVNLHSPINGFVTKVNVNIGKYVNPSDVLFELVNPDDIHAAVTVFEKDINSFKAGIKGVVSLADQSGTKYNVEVILVAKNIDDTRSGLVHCHFENPSHNLLPGMFLTGVFELNNKATDAISEEAVVKYEGKEYIFLTKNGTTFSLHQVETGARENGYVELEPDSVKVWMQTRVVVKGAYALLGMLKNKMEEE